MKPITRKRLVSSCIPCYVKKQKCDRKYPCDHCAKRRRPDECVYHAYPNSQGDGQSLARPTNVPNVVAQLEDPIPNTSSLGQPGVALSLPGRDLLPLTERYGYLESSDSNTLALIRKFGGDEIGQQDSSTRTLVGEDANEVKGLMERMPTRRILDFLIQFFVSEVSWVDQLIYPPWFLGRYHNRRGEDQTLCVADVEFLVLVLRVCSYASQFLPSQYYTLDRISGVSLTDIDKSCEETANRLSAVACQHDGRGCWVRVQHTTFLALKFQTEGKMTDSWAALSHAVRAAQNDGMDQDKPSPGRRLNELHKEMRRRTYCYLYVWDSYLSRLLDRVPLLPDSGSKKTWTQMRLVYIKEGSSDGEAETGADSPDDYAQGILQAHMATFWRRFDVRYDGEYDMMVAEERYEQFCNEFLASLPASFSLRPNRTWDKRRPKLPLLRQLLHISIFDSLCWNFRPLLFETSHDASILPPYKRLLLSCQKKALAAAALQMLDAVGNLHRMLGGSHTRFVKIIVPTFEAAVPLACLCMDPQFPEDDDRDDSESNAKEEASQTDPLRTTSSEVTRGACVQAVQDALQRLRMLAEVSNVAEVGAQTLGRLLDKMTITTTKHNVNHEEDASVMPSHHDLMPLDDSQIQGWPYFAPLDHASIDAAGSVSESQGSYHDRLDTFMSGFGTGTGS